MKRALGIYRARAEAGTSFGIAYHQFTTDSYSVDELGYSQTTIQTDECWEVPKTSVGVQYQVRAYGDLTFVFLALTQRKGAPKTLNQLKKPLRAWEQLLGGDAAHAGADLSSHCLASMRSERSDTLASTSAPRNRIAHGLVPTDFGNVESMNFLSALVRLERTNKSRAAARYVYSRFYDLRMAEDYPLCDRILGDVDAERLTPVVLIALLTITAPIKKELDSRARFYDKAQQAIERQRGAEATKQLLAGLE